MSKILDLYVDIKESEQRFVDEVFEAEIYRAACPQLTIIDAGAYEGEFAFYCYNFAKKIYALEPDPRPWKVLKDRVKKFDLDDRIKILDKALAKDTGERYFNATGFGGSRIIGEQDEVHQSEDKIKVKTISLQDLTTKYKIEQVDILKLDIEGGEAEVIRSSEFPKLSKKIKVIIGEHLEPVKGLLEELGYKSRDVKGGNTLYER